MFKSLIFLMLLATALSETVPSGLLPLLDGRIVGGEATTISAFPWQISLQRSGSHFCGGSIYSKTIIITAAHCLRSASTSILKVRAGSSYWNSDGELIAVADFKIHEGFNLTTLINDIGIIKLASPLVDSSTTKSIVLASTVPAHGAQAVVTGWGVLQPGDVSLPAQLQKVEVLIVGRTECASSLYGYGSQIKPTMICAIAPGKDSCQGDSGGPLVVDNQLAGVVSWGYGCANPKYPGVYADVAALKSWVEQAAAAI